MDIDRGLVKAILKEGLADLQVHGIFPAMLEGSGKDAFEFVDLYWRQHGKLPTGQLLEDQLGVTLYDVPVEPLNFWAAEIKKRHLYLNMQEVLQGVMDKLETADSHGALDRYRDGFFQLESLFKNSAGVELIFDDVDDIVAEYEQSKLGITGVPTPYPALNEITQGWQPEELIVVAGRPGAGKSFWAILCSTHAWRHGRKTMMVSTEMSRRAMRRRHAALITKTPYGKLKKGKLTSVEEARFAAELLKLKGDKNLLMMGKNMRVTLETIEAQAMIHRPDLLIIDGFYLLRSSKVTAKQKHERIAELLDLTKEMAKNLQIPVMITTQMNRSSEKGKSKAAPDLERLAFSDNMGMIADYVLFLDRSEAMRTAKEMRVTPVKVREGEFIGCIISTWDFDKIEFHQRRVEDSTTKSDAPPPGDEEAPYGSAPLPDGTPPEEQGPW